MNNLEVKKILIIKNVIELLYGTIMLHYNFLFLFEKYKYFKADKSYIFFSLLYYCLFVGIPFNWCLQYVKIKIKF